VCGLSMDEEMIGVVSLLQSHLHHLQSQGDIDFCASVMMVEGWGT